MPPHNETIKRIIRTLEDASGLDLQDTPPESGFFEMGLDSLLLTQVANLLQKEFSKKVTFRQLLEEFPSPAALASHFGASGVEPKPAAVSPPKREEEPPREAGGASFGAQTRITVQREPGLGSREQAALDALIARYTERTAESKKSAERHRPHLADPRVVSGFRPGIKEAVYPIVVDRSEGARLHDIDGNSYIDLTCGFGSNLFGNSAAFIADAVRDQLDRGYEIGPQHPLAGEVARLFTEVTELDRAALCNTGSEAVLGALRLARTVTGNDLVVAFSGGYHGIVDEVIVRGVRGRSFPAAPGIPRSAVENILILDYDDPASIEVIRSRAHEIAAVLVEPVQSRRPGLQPREFLHELRRITREAGCALIMDEVITGFRIHPGGAQAHFGVDADIATYGKIVGGGMPIGVIAGKRRFMDALDGGPWRFGDESQPEIGVTYFAGTFVRHPLALAAAKAVLEKIEHDGGALQEGLNRRTDAMVAEINAFLDESRAPFRLHGFGSLFKPIFDEGTPNADLLYLALRSRDIHIWDARPCFLTLAHTDEDIEAVIQAFRESVTELQDGGLMPGGAPAGLASEPPLEGARLGRDLNGRPAWFVADPRRPGKYLLVEEEIS